MSFTENNNQFEEGNNQDSLDQYLNDEIITRAESLIEPYQLSNHKIPQKTDQWDSEEQQKYEKICQLLHPILIEKDGYFRRIFKIFQIISLFIQTRNSDQIKSHHQKVFEKIKEDLLISTYKMANFRYIKPGNNKSQIITVTNTYRNNKTTILSPKCYRFQKTIRKTQADFLKKNRKKYNHIWNEDK